MILPDKLDSDPTIAPGTQWCQIFPVDAGDNYGVACQWGNNATVPEGDEYTLLNLHAITPGGRAYDPCNSYLPFACVRTMNDPTIADQKNFWPTVNVRGKPCFVTEGNIQTEENNACFKSLKECNPDWYKLNGDRMPTWRPDLKAYEGWPTDNYVPVDTGEPEGTGPPIPRCWWNQNRGKGASQGNRPQGFPQGFPRQQGGRPQGNGPLGFPGQQGGRPQSNNPRGWPQGNRPQNDREDDD